MMTENNKKSQSTVCGLAKEKFTNVALIGAVPGLVAGTALNQYFNLSTGPVGAGGGIGVSVIVATALVSTAAAVCAYRYAFKNN